MLPAQARELEFGSLKHMYVKSRGWWRAPGIPEVERRKHGDS